MAKLADAVPGAPILASWHNTNRDRTVQPFTTASARNTDLPSPTAGMVTYQADTDVLTMWNGSAWVTITPVAALVATSEQRSATSYGDLSTVGPAVTIETGTKALISVSAGATVVAGAALIAYVAVQVSGATTVAAADGNALIMSLQGGAGWPSRSSIDVYLSGLTAGSNTFTLKYKCSAATAIAFEQRTIAAVGIA
jgi:hypothetical protein